MTHATFQELAEPYRRQLQVHCYRMLGSFHEAEDLVQETFLRAWGARDRFEGRTSFRNWLYRIATNACLNTLAARSTTSRRMLPEAYGPPTDRPLSGKPAPEVAWVEPYPDSALDDIVDAAPGPDARYELRESVQLAFVAAIQQLPPRQRAVLLLRDVLGWSASDTAQLLEATLPAVNSALQRARATVETRFPTGQPNRTAATNARQRELLERYVQAWENADIDGLVAILKHDAVLSMPPWQQWYLGHASIRVFLNWVWREGPLKRVRLLPTLSNGQPAFGQYMPARHGNTWEAHGLQVVTLDGEAISAITVFRDTTVLARFGLPEVLPAAGAVA